MLSGSSLLVDNPHVPQVFGHRSIAQGVKSQPIISTIPFSAQSGESSHSAFLVDAPPLVESTEVVEGFFAGHTAGLTSKDISR